MKDLKKILNFLENTCGFVDFIVFSNNINEDVEITYSSKEDIFLVSVKHSKKYYHLFFSADSLLKFKDVKSFIDYIINSEECMVSEHKFTLGEMLTAHMDHHIKLFKTEYKKS